MVLSDEKKREYMRRLLFSRMRLLINNGFYGLLLMHMVYAIDENCETAGTDGKRIYFGPQFLDDLSDQELDFIMMHEILHVVLQHCFRQGDRDNERFNIACDIVVNSNILVSKNRNHHFITLKKYGESMHLAPDGKEGCEYTAEQVYEMLPQCKGNVHKSALSGTRGSFTANDDSGKAKESSWGKEKQKQDNKSKPSAVWDDHTRWGLQEENETLREEWIKHFEDACEVISIRDPSNQRGMLPLFAERLFKDLKKPQIDWRTILNNFVQEEIVDYSFTPPDRRFGDSPFFLPDFNDKDKGDIVEDILFMIDTSASMTDDMITAAYSEVKGAIDQFDGRLKGWLGFFDAAIIEPKPFTNEAEFKIIKPAGGGGTDFQIIFEYVRKHMQDKLPACIIILTDGFAPFPEESLSQGIPVLWLLNNEEVDPPWGKAARM